MTFSFGDPAAGVYGLARIGLAGVEREASALAVLFSDREPVAALAHGGIAVAAGASFADLELPGVRATIEEPLRRWTVRVDDGGHGFDLTFEAAGPPAEVEPSEPTARVGGMSGYVQLCRVHGTAWTDGGEHALRGLGTRTHAWGQPDWERIGSTRSVAAWLDDGSGLALCAVRPAGTADHEHETTWAALLGAAGNLRVDEPRLSTTYDDAGRQRRAALELWVGEQDSAPRRATGEVVCGSTLDLGRLRLDCAFLRWRMDGRSGIGRYDVLRRA